MKKIITILYVFSLFFLVIPVGAAPFGAPPTVEKTCTSDTDCPDTYCLPPSGTLAARCSSSKLQLGEKCERPLQCQTGSCQGSTCVNPVTEAPPVKFQAIAPTLEVDVPTLKPFTTNTIKQPDESGYIYIPFLGQYISAIFRWALLMAGTLAAVLVMFGGFVYMTAGGNAQRTKEGVERITHALLGLVLLLASYTILYIINPDLVSFKSLKIQAISRIEFADDPASMTTPKDGPACTGKNEPSRPSPDGGKTYLGQLDNLACGSRSSKSIKYIVLHEGARTTASTVSVFKSRNVSSHYSIDRDGTVEQLVGELKTAWHAGAINQFSIGIDLSIAANCPGSGRTANCTVTDEQYTSLKKLLNGIVRRTGAQYLDSSIIGHCQVTGTDHIDVRNFDWSKIGLNNAEHYTDPNDFNSKCKIAFDWATYKQTYLKETGADVEPYGCCNILEETQNISGGDKFNTDPNDAVNFIEMKEKECSQKEQDLILKYGENIKTTKTWYKGPCLGYGN